MPIQEFLRPAAKVEAVQWTGHNLDEVIAFADGAEVSAASGLLTVALLSGPAVLQVGSWLVRENTRLLVCTDAAKQTQCWEPLAQAV